MKNHTTMTDEQRAAHEAATIEGMHQQTAPQPPAAPVADVCGDDDAPDMEYTYNAPRLDLVPVRADELERLRAVNERLGQESVANLTLIAELRSHITELHSDYSVQIATLELRVRELERENADLRLIIETADEYAPHADKTCDDPGITFIEAIRRMLADDGKIVYDWRKAVQP